MCIFFGDAAVKLSSPSLANIVVLRSQTTKLLYFHHEKDDDVGDKKVYDQELIYAW